MFEGYLKLGDVELVNSSRAKGYGETSDCPLNWFECECDGLNEALLEDFPYTADNIQSAPWYDPRNPESERFYGVSGLALRSISDSTRYAEYTEGITDGGVVGESRRASPSVRARAWLSANGQDALEYGMAWLGAAVRSRRCAQHDYACGGASLEFFVDCPPGREIVPDFVAGGYGAGPYGYGPYGSGPAANASTRPQNDAEYLPIISSQKRYMHGVKVISGPIEVDTRKSSDGRHWGRLVEFTLYAENPGIYSAPRILDTPPTLPSIVQDSPRNLVPYPSAELASGTVTVAENFSTNPSVETNATGWVAAGSAVSGSAPTIAGSRSTDLSASGVASFLVTATGAGVAVHDVIAYQDVAITPTAGTRHSVTIWGAMLFAGSGGSGVSLSARVEWRASGGTILKTDSLGSITSAFAGRVFSAKSLEVPATAATARVIVAGLANLTAATVVRVFADALTVSNP